MIRRPPCRCCCSGRGAAFGADPAPPADEETEETSFTSAAVGGRFGALPPSEYGLPIEILGRMRIRLGGEPPVVAEMPAEAPEAAPSNEH